MNPSRESRASVISPYTSRARGPIGYCRRTAAMLTPGSSATGSRRRR